MTFEQALRLAGLMPRAIVADGKWRRCPTEDKPRKRNGAYVLHPDGRGYWRNWALDTAVSDWRDDSARPARQIDQEQLRKARERERAERHRAIHAARAHWEKCTPLVGVHPYLEAKGLSPVGTQELRTWRDRLVVPVMWNGRVLSLQSITAEGVKRFWPGAPVKGGAFELRRERAAVTVLCEGLATGLAVFQCVRKARVIVAFDAGNLQPALEHLHPTGSVVIAADNDHGTQARRGFNPGVEKARNAAELIGCGVAYPQDIEGTDWADALKEWGERAARRIEREIQAGIRFVNTQAATA